MHNCQWEHQTRLCLVGRYKCIDEKRRQATARHGGPGSLLANAALYSNLQLADAALPSASTRLVVYISLQRANESIAGNLNFKDLPFGILTNRIMIITWWAAKQNIAPKIAGGSVEKLWRNVGDVVRLCRCSGASVCVHSYFFCFLCLFSYPNKIMRVLYNWTYSSDSNNTRFSGQIRWRVFDSVVFNNRTNCSKGLRRCSARGAARGRRS